jgi:hypothetical protein
MVGQILPNNNESATVTFIQFFQLNTPLESAILFGQRCCFGMLADGGALGVEMPRVYALN